MYFKAGMVFVNIILFLLCINSFNFFDIHCSSCSQLLEMKSCNEELVSASTIDFYYIIHIYFPCITPNNETLFYFSGIFPRSRLFSKGKKNVDLIKVDIINEDTTTTTEESVFYFIRRNHIIYFELPRCRIARSAA